MKAAQSRKITARIDNPSLNERSGVSVFPSGPLPSPGSSVVSGLTSAASTSTSPPQVIRAKVNSSAKVGASGSIRRTSGATRSPLQRAPSPRRVPSPVRPASPVRTPSVRPASPSRVVKPKSIITSSLLKVNGTGNGPASASPSIFPSFDNRGLDSAQMPRARPHTASMVNAKRPASAISAASTTNAAPIRVTAKVTSSARLKGELSPGSASSTPELRNRTPSISLSDVSTHQRRPSLRQIPAQLGFQSFSPTTKLPDVDPIAIPLPQQSPPGSTVSFSSRSSVSLSPAISPALSPATHSFARALERTASPPVLIRQPSSSAEDDNNLPSPILLDDAVIPDHFPGKTESRLRDEAKSNRKMADLEITNRSLLAINTTLEGTKHKQSKEIRELRRRLRETRLALPPPVFKSLKPLKEDEEENDSEDSSADGEEGQDEETFGADDVPFMRVRKVLETLIADGRTALASTPEEHTPPISSGVKVLHAEELKDLEGRATPKDHYSQEVGASG